MVRMLVLLSVAAIALGTTWQSDGDAVDPALAALRAEAVALRDLVRTDAARAMLDAVPTLPPAAPTTVWFRPGGGYLVEAFTAEQHAALPEAEREGMREVKVDTERYYQTFYGSPLASIRAYDLAAARGIASFEGTRVLDFGFGSVGQLRLLAACGAEAIGAEVMPLLRAIYAGEETLVRETVRGPGGRTGTVTMVFGRWPAAPEVIDAVGAGLDLFVSKNTIKRGYVSPPVETSPGQQLDFGVEPAVFLDRLHAALAPGGLAVFYNLGGRPAAAGEPYNPAADIASPWSRETYEKHGFEVVALDEDDSVTARRVGSALGWDRGDRPMDLENALFARYTILRRPRERRE
jgi:hypothetical protein